MKTRRIIWYTTTNYVMYYTKTLYKNILYRIHKGEYEGKDSLMTSICFQMLSYNVFWWIYSGNYIFSFFFFALPEFLSIWTRTNIVFLFIFFYIKVVEKIIFSFFFLCIFSLWKTCCTLGISISRTLGNILILAYNIRRYYIKIRKKIGK